MSGRNAVCPATTMSRTIRLPPSPPPADASELLDSVAGEEDPGAALDAPVPPPRAPLSGPAAGESPGGPPPGPSRPSRSS